ncbi:hypothetical protein [Variovorax sp. PAMC26660]|uniref:hypothetical protein n=1 Tax=Variovorax sp. PAMC26660 TaxID=2762322 RepID=UPI00164E334D|nr:hypothetical protein [Variovorax sp. PAMC26660]QNK71830.1 hypothetical protein H7F35_29200 [Variovorax sp. PAMC26660]
MSSRFGSSLAGNEGRIRTAMSRGASKPFMSEKQIEAYLIARDLLRAIQRASSASQHGQAFNFLAGTQGDHPCPPHSQGGRVSSPKIPDH